MQRLNPVSGIWFIPITKHSKSIVLNWHEGSQSRFRYLVHSDTSSKHGG